MPHSVYDRQRQRADGTTGGDEQRDSGDGVLGFLLVKIVGPVLQTGPEYVLEAAVSGIPLLIAAGCAVSALALAVVHKVRHRAA